MENRSTFMLDDESKTVSSKSLFFLNSRCDVVFDGRVPLHSEVYNFAVELRYFGNFAESLEIDD